MEIERKWMVKDWPKNLPLLHTQMMRQGYISTEPTVRIREEAMIGTENEQTMQASHTDYVLCFKSHGDATGMAREEIEINLSPEDFQRLEVFIRLPLIPKERRTYQLPDGNHLEVNLVDLGLPTEFRYAEVEFPDMQTATDWQPSSVGLQDYLNDEVTGQPGQSMAAYWVQTRKS